MINIGKIYCKDVIKVIDNFKKSGIKNKKISKRLDDDIFKSYLKLEKMIKYNSNNN